MECVHSVAVAWGALQSTNREVFVVETSEGGTTFPSMGRIFILEMVHFGAF